MKGFRLILIMILMIMVFAVFVNASPRPLVYYSFNDDASDYYGNYDGTNNGATHLASGCISGGCYDFEVSDTDYLSTNYLLDSGTDFTISVMAYVESSISASALWGSYTVAGANGMQLYDYSGFSKWMINPPATIYTTPVDTNGWTHVVIRYNQTNISIYINGSLGNTSKITPFTNSGIGFTMGRPGAYDGQYYDGLLDEVAIYNQALSGLEILELYNNNGTPPQLTTNFTANAKDSYNSTSINNFSIYLGGMKYDSNVSTGEVVTDKLYNDTNLYNITFESYNYANRTYLNINMSTLLNGVLSYSSNRIDNCSVYNNVILNWTFYRSASVITDADDNVNLTFTFEDGRTQVFSELNYDIPSWSLCSDFNDTITSVSGNLMYSGDWTDGWVYNYAFTDKLLNNSVITYLNLTVPKLFLNFSVATDIVVITSEDVIAYNDTKILIGMSSLALGKVAVIFNNGSQYFEYYNDWNTYIHEDLYIIDDQDDYFQIRAQDETFSILSKAQIKIWEIDITTNNSKLVNVLYDNSEKSIYLDSDQFYLARSYYTGYEQEGGFSPFKPAQTEGNSYPIIMSRNSSSDTITFKVNRDTRLPFMNNLPTHYLLDIEISSREIMSEAYVELYINDSYVNTYTMTGDDYEFKMCGGILCDYTSIWFLNSYDNLTLIAYATDKYGSANKTFVFRHFEKEQRYESAYHDVLLYSRFAFLIFFMLSIGLSITIQKKFKDYGIQSLTFISTLLSFINLYMLVLSIPLILMFIAKKVMGEDV